MTQKEKTFLDQTAQRTGPDGIRIPDFWGMRGTDCFFRLVWVHEKHGK